MINPLRNALDKLQGKAPRGKKRSSQWPKVRKEFLSVFNSCEVCGRNKRRHMLEVHHIIPFHVAPELELDDSNLITLCRRCHLVFGHLNNWRHYNETINEDAILWNYKITLGKGLNGLGN